jgi:hypothetical protein
MFNAKIPFSAKSARFRSATASFFSRTLRSILMMLMFQEYRKMNAKKIESLMRGVAAFLFPTSY